MSWATYDGLTLTGLSPSSLVGTDANKQLATNAAQLSPSFVAATLGAGVGGVAGGLVLSGVSTGAPFNIYGSQAVGAHQWDLYQSSTDLRFTDRTGGGSVQFDSTVRLRNLPARFPGDFFLVVDKLGNVHRSAIGPTA